ncbi:hypothetical protein BKA80DRAFT_269359 [Phyllosticta citrichinensis]
MMLRRGPDTPPPQFPFHSSPSITQPRHPSLQPLRVPFHHPFPSSVAYPTLPAHSTLNPTPCHSRFNIVVIFRKRRHSSS